MAAGYNRAMALGMARQNNATDEEIDDIVKFQNVSDGIASAPAVILFDVFVTKGWLSSSVSAYSLGEFYHSAEMQSYHRDRGNEEMAKQYEQEGANASIDLGLEIIFGGTVKLSKSVLKPLLKGRKINIWGEGELANFEDFATNRVYAKGGNDVLRPMTSTISDGQAVQIAVNNSPLDSYTISEIKRISQKGTTVVYSSPADGGQFDILKEGLGESAKILEDVTKTIDYGDYSFDQRVVTYEIIK